MDACQLIRERLRELGREQRELAAAAEVTESYVSQLLSRKKSPPAPERTDIYEKMEAFLKLPPGRLSELVRVQRSEELRKRLGELPPPTNPGVREFVLFKCRRPEEAAIGAEFDRHAFGSVERLVTQTLLDVAKDIARSQLRNDRAIRTLARRNGGTLARTRATILEFLDTDVYHLTQDCCEAYLDPLIESWTIDLARFRMEVALNHELSGRHMRRFEFVESGPFQEEPGFREFLRDRTLSGDATDEELSHLRSLRFDQKRPTKFYFYRALQNLRDPLHFHEPSDR